MAPSNVLNISQFITWILQAYQAQTIENTALQENQDILNHKLKESYDELKTLGSENAELGHSLAALRAKSTTIETPPAPTNPAIKEKPNYLSYLGL
jgi:predicted nuclease with TOPRIM domain